DDVEKMVYTHTDFKDLHAAKLYAELLDNNLTFEACAQLLSTIASDICTDVMKFIKSHSPKLSIFKFETLVHLR
ncbi:hypothetical protein J1N35_038489, partial [Gossypium stocksii]